MKTRRTRKIGSICIGLGVLLIMAAALLGGYNLWDDHRAQQEAAKTLEQLPMSEKALPYYKYYPEMEMPSLEVDGHWYIGKLDIPALELSLPIISAWSYPELKVAPCRYSGSAYTDDLIILAHNYKSHFGSLKSLYPDEVVIFTDMNGNVFNYKVVDLEVLDGTAVEDMQAGDWDLTLFTCTVGGRNRVTVRCERLGESGPIGRSFLTSA